MTILLNYPHHMAIKKKCYKCKSRRFQWENVLKINQNTFHNNPLIIYNRLSVLAQEPAVPLQDLKTTWTQKCLEWEAAYAHTKFKSYWKEP